MEKKMKAKQHKKHKHQVHRPLDAYELYELEHMSPQLVKLPSDHHDRHNKPRAHEASTESYWHSLGGSDGGLFRPNNHETVRPYWRPQEDEENVDDEAEKFIQLEHQKFELSKWMSTNTK